MFHFTTPERVRRVNISPHNKLSPRLNLDGGLHGVADVFPASIGTVG